MKKIVFFFSFLLFSLGLIAQDNFHSFSVKDITGKEFDLGQFKGKRVLVVNTASKCGFTPQYAQLQELYDTYKSEDFVVLAFPANDFMKQEPGSNEQILEFCTEKYAVSFPIMSKISVKGKDIHPLYKWLTSKSENGVEDSSVSWNFQKYLIDENGNLVKHFAPKIKPMDKDIINSITE